MNNCYRAYFQCYDETGAHYAQIGLESIGSPSTAGTTMTWDWAMFGNVVVQLTWGGGASDYLVRVPFGQIQFPATQNPSSNANTLDDYDEANWTPTITFTTPGDVSVSYATQNGRVTKIGRMVLAEFNLTFTPTFTTASGSLLINNVTDASASFIHMGSMHWTGITKAGYTQINPRLGAINNTTIDFVASGSALGAAAVATTDLISGVQMILRGEITYIV
jgi:hypothetical protein